MRVLFLDDDELRIKAFLKKVPKATIAKTAQEIIARMKEGQADWLFLDHDLRGVKYDDPSRNDTGSEVVRWIIANMPKVDRIVVHSANAVSGATMTHDLLKAGYVTYRIPFPFLLSKLKIKFHKADRTLEEIGEREDGGSHPW